MTGIASQYPTTRSDSAEPRSRERDWRQSYASRLVVTDIAVLVWAVFGASFANFGLASESLSTPPHFSDVRIDYLVVSAVLVVSWTAMLAGVGSRGYRMIGTGTSEFKAVLQSGIFVLVLIALVTFLFQVEFSRGFVLFAIPAGLGGLLLSRWLWRSWLRAQRQRGRFCSRVLLVGSLQSASQIADDLRRNPDAGYLVVGACVSTGEIGAELPGTSIPVMGTVDHLLKAVTACNADTVFVVGGHNLSPNKMRRLSWSLEPGRQHLVIAPSLTDIAGPRIHSRPVAGLPLIHVETPRYEGTDRFLKRAFDVSVSLALLLVLSIPLLIVAAIVARTPGGVFFSHERIGKNGRPFRMLKFRSMIADADAQLGALLKAQGTEVTPLFKIENDPRITPVGAFIRRYSIDEVPQLINVLRGDMSLVGPRPQVAKEVALYDNAAARRLFVRPGMTGLWQVSGRSNLDWKESVRLDLYYVENWSLTADIAILARTVRAVLASDGAV
jgi:exopolysaccharide biosynthesis polyprenyl glycosylphosphotransferase